MVHDTTLMTVKTYTANNDNCWNAVSPYIVSNVIDNKCTQTEIHNRSYSACRSILHLIQAKYLQLNFIYRIYRHAHMHVHTYLHTLVRELRILGAVTTQTSR